MESRAAHVARVELGARLLRELSNPSSRNSVSTAVIARGLGDELILARSPQTKGRVERAFGMAQDLLVKEMRVAGVATFEGATRFLAECWIPLWNERFAVAAADPRDAHRPLPPGSDLEALFAETETRVVGRDCTGRWKNGFWKIPEAQAQARAAGVRPGLRIVVERRLWARCASAAASGTSPPGRWASSVLRLRSRRPLRRIRVRSRDRTIRGASRFATR